MNDDSSTSDETAKDDGDEPKKSASQVSLVLQRSLAQTNLLQITGIEEIEKNNESKEPENQSILLFLTK